MKILREGVLPAAAAVPWWVGKTAECRVCGCQVELEANDDRHGTSQTLGPNGPMAITSHAERHIGGRQWVTGPCPTPDCPGKLELENVFASQVTGAAVARGEFNPPLAKP